MMNLIAESGDEFEIGSQGDVRVLPATPLSTIAFNDKAELVGVVQGSRHVEEFSLSLPYPRPVLDLVMSALDNAFYQGEESFDVGASISHSLAKVENEDRYSRWYRRQDEERGVYEQSAS